MAEGLEQETLNAVVSQGRPTPSNNGKRKIGSVLFVLLLVAGAVAGVRYYLNARVFETTDDAFIDSDIVRVSPQAAGRVLKVCVSDNQMVNAGDLLVEIDPQPYEINVNLKGAALKVAETRHRTAGFSMELTDTTSDAGLDQAGAGVAAAREAVAQARAGVAATEAEVKRTSTDLERYNHLEDSVISRQLRDQAEAAAKVAAARLDQMKKQVTTAEAEVQVAEGRLAAAKGAPQQKAVSASEAEARSGEVEQAQAALHGAELDLTYTKIYAPRTGRVTHKAVQVGEFVQIGQSLMAVVSPDIWVVANFKETQLADMRPGQPVEIRVDAYPDIVLHGKVDSMQAGSGARFSLLPPENATGNYVKVVQRVPVKILLDEKLGSGSGLKPDLPGRDVAPGMSVVPRVRVR